MPKQRIARFFAVSLGLAGALFLLPVFGAARMCGWFSSWGLRTMMEDQELEKLHKAGPPPVHFRYGKGGR